MKKRLLIFLSILFIICKTSIGQERTYQRMMADMRVNFFTVCDSAETYFQSHDKGKGSGYVQYQRWKNENMGKYYPSGNRMVDPEMPYKEYLRIQLEQPHNKNQSLFQTGGWQSLGPDTIDQISGHYAAGIGRVEYMLVNPSNEDQIYMGSRSGGLWVTRNGGQTWYQQTDFLPASGVNVMAAKPGYFDSVLINVRNASNGHSFGIYRSVDAGLTFSQTPFIPTNLGFGGLGSNFQIFTMKYHPRIPGLLFIGTDRGLFRSTDDLNSWTRIGTSWDVKDIEFHPTNDAVVYIYENDYYGSNKNKVLRSTDYGQNFTPLADISGNSDQQLNISITGQCQNCIIVASNRGIWMSDDMGDTYRTKIYPAPVGVSLWDAVPNDLDTMYFLSGYVDLFRSENSADTFGQCTYWSLGNANHGSGSFMANYSTSKVYVHADCNYKTCVNGKFYACTDGFLCRSNDQGKTWTKLSLKVGTRENYCLGLSQSNHYISISGSQDNGTSIKKRSGWLEFFGADGMEAIIHPLNPNYMIGSYQYGGRVRTMNGGLSSDNVTPKNNNGSWIAPLLFNPKNPFEIYHFDTAIWRSQNFGSNWDYQSQPSSIKGQISSAAIARNNPKLIAISRQEKIELSSDGGYNFTSIRGALPTLSISYIAFDPKNDSTIYVTYEDWQSNKNKVFMTTNLGKSWTNITYNLGNMPIHCVVVDETDSGNIYVGAQIGIYRKSKDGTFWFLYNQDLPNVTVNELEINKGSNTIKAATWGRGLWEYSVYGRNTFPAISITSITNPPTMTMPKVSVPQYVTSVVEYSGTLKSVYVMWSKGNTDFNSSQVIPMTKQGDGTWKSNYPLPDDTAGTKIYFKVVAIGQNADTSSTFDFMYQVRKFEYCVAEGERANGNLYLTDVSLSNMTNNGTDNSTYTYYENKPVTLYRDSTYEINTIHNTGWPFNDLIVWIDYNNDTEFDTVERVVLDLNTDKEGQGTFKVPNSAQLDTVRMRVRLGYWGNYDFACGTTLGEVEDYPVVIKTAAVSSNVEVIKKQQDDIQIFPNPVKDILYIQSKNTELNKCMVMDAMGRVCIVADLRKSRELDVSTLISGLYILNIDGQIYRVVVE